MTDLTDKVGALGVPTTYVPEGWDSAKEFLDHFIEVYEADAQFDSDNRKWALDDLKFVAGEQWDPTTKALREKAMRPCLTINVLPQFIGQVIGDRRMNKVAVRVRPLRSGDEAIANARSGLIKSIEMYSRADRVYDAACEDQTACGISNFRIDLDYAANDVFDQDIFIRHIPNPLAVVWDRMSVDPTGRDATHCFVTDSIPKELFKRKYAGVECPTDLAAFPKATAGWMDSKTVRITECWELIEKPATFMLAADGDVKDITGKLEEEWIKEAWIDPATGKPRIRQSTRTYARMHLISAFAILSEAYEIPLTRLPIIRVEGRVVRVGDDRVRFGLTRFAKDSQRLKNYWRSVAAETLAMAPKAQWIADSAAIENREKAFREAHLTGDPLLIFNKGQDAPQRVDPPAVPAALLQEATLNQQDIKDTTGLHDASLGIRSNEVSGKAIDARKAEGDIATIIYHDNLNAAILEGGVVINELIPIAYDALRTVRIIGEDDKDSLVVINDPNDENSPNIAMGRYDVVLDTGPSFLTQRLEAQAGMRELLQTNPELMSVIGDLVAKNMDWPGAHEIAERIKKTMPPEITAETEEDGQPQMSPEQMQQMQQAQAMQEAQLAEAQAQLEHAAQIRQIELAEAQEKLRKSASDADIAEEQARKARADADAAEAKAEAQAVEAAYAPVRHEQTLAHAEDAHEQKLSQAEDKHTQGLAQSEDSRYYAAQDHQMRSDHAQQGHDLKMSQSKPRPGEEKSGAPSKKEIK